MKPGAESPVIYDFIRRYTIRSYLKVEAFFTPARSRPPWTTGSRRYPLRVEGRKYVLSATGYERIFGREKVDPGATGYVRSCYIDKLK